VRRRLAHRHVAIAGRLSRARAGAGSIAHAESGSG